MPIRIPLEVHPVTIIVQESQIVQRTVQVGPRTDLRRERVTVPRDIPPRQDRASFDRALSYTNAVFAPHDICFYCASFEPVSEEIPNGAAQVDVNGFLYLAARYPAGSGLSVLLVADFERSDLGGQAVEARSVCIVCSLGDPGTGKVLAHELGHLLDLSHVALRSTRSNYNLMYPAYRAGDELTATQRGHARGSRTGRRFGGP